MSEEKESMVERAAEVKDAAVHKAEDAIDAVKKASGGIFGKIGEIAENVKDKAVDAMHAAVEKAEDLSGKDLNRDGTVGSGEKSE